MTATDLATDRPAGVDHGLLPLTASMLLGTAGLMCIGTAPLSMGAMVETGRLTASAMGRVATVELVVLALGGLIGPTILSGGSMRHRLVAASALLLGINLLTYWCGLPVSIYLVRMAAGFLEGILLSSTMMMMVSSRDPERFDAAYLAASTIPQVAANYALAMILIPQFGDVAGFGVMATVALVSIGAASVMPKTAPHRQLPPLAAVTSPLSVSVFLIALAVILNNAAIGCVWYYLERLGALAGAPRSDVGMAVALFLVAQFFGAMTATGKRDFYGNRFALFYLSLLLAALTIAFLVFRTGFPLLALTAAYGFFQILLSPCSVKLFVAFDPSGRIAMQLMSLTLVGLAGGSLATSFLVTRGDVSPAYWLGAVLMAGAGIISALAVKIERTGNRSTTSIQG